DYFEVASSSVATWLAEWGGLESWSKHLDSGYRAALAADGVDKWVESVLEHADRGRLLEKMLGQMETTLPLEMWKIRELWRQHSILLGQVVKALALVDIRVGILRAGPFNL
ncbi:hypothetical protein BDN72DRAFT_728206, partial [Pluteus cervinus]